MFLLPRQGGVHGPLLFRSLFHSPLLPLLLGRRVILLPCVTAPSDAAQAKPVRQTLQNIISRERFLKFADCTNPVKQYIIESI